MENKTREILECNEQEDMSHELYSNYIGVFGFIRLTQSGTYYVYYPEYKGFLKAKHTIFITQELNRLNKYDSYKEKMKHGL
jgi:hypothetical protein